MACLKCGRDTAEGQVFCPDCLAQMTRYPVQPGTIIQIPNRKSSAQRRSAKRRPLPPEEQVKLLRARLRTLTVLFLVVLLLAVGSSALVIRALVRRRLPTGQNYSSTNISTISTSESVSRETSTGTP